MRTRRNNWSPNLVRALVAFLKGHTRLSPFRRNVLSLFGLQIINYAAPLVTLPYLVRVLGPERFGLLAFAQATVQYFVLITEYGFNLSASRQIAIHRSSPQNLGRIFWSTLTVKCLLAAIGFAVLVALTQTFHRFEEESAVYLATFLKVLGYALLPGWYLLGREKMPQIAAAQAAATLISVVAIFSLVDTESDYVLAATLQSANLLLAAAIGHVMVLRVAPVRWQMPSLSSLGTELKQGWHVFVATMSTSLYTNTNVFVLGLFAGSTAVGYFSAADKVVRAVQGMFTPITEAMYPRINAVASRSRDEALQFVSRGIRWLLFGTGIAAVTLFVFADPILRLVLGGKFQEAIGLARVMSILPPILTLDSIFGVQILLSFGFRREYARVVVGGGILNVALLVPLTWTYGASGTASTVVLTEIVIVGVMLFILRQYGLDPWRGQIRASPRGL